MICANGNIDSKIDLLDAPEVVAKKIKKATAAPQVVEDNGVLAFVEFVLLPASGLKGGKREFKVDRERDGLEPLVYGNIAQMQDDYRNDVVCLHCDYQPVHMYLKDKRLTVSNCSSLLSY